MKQEVITHGKNSSNEYDIIEIIVTTIRNIFCYLIMKRFIES